MSQRYFETFIGVIRQSATESFTSYPYENSTIQEETVKETMQNSIIINYSDGNHEIYQEMVLIPDAVNYVIFDETYTPVPLDPTYSTKFIALIKETSTSNWSVYTGTGQTIIFSVDKTTFLATLRQAYGDGTYRIFQKVVESAAHGFVVVP